MRRAQNIVLLLACALPHVAFAEAAQALGSYRHGQLQNGTQLPASGADWVKVFRARNCDYGTRETIAFIQDLAHRFRKNFPGTERFQIGDISTEKGGAAEGHGSHKNGLDVDIVYLRVRPREQDPAANDWLERFADGENVTANFATQKNWALLSLVARNDRVDRVFVDFGVLKAFFKLLGASCSAPENLAVLEKLLVFPLHDTHFHVRLKCPSMDSSCVPAKPITRKVQLCPT